MILFIDTEVKAPFPGALDKLGLDNYARHPDTKLLLVSYAIDDGPAKVWDLSCEIDGPRDLFEAAMDRRVRVVAHNAQFDRIVLQAKGLWISNERWYCTRARAYAHGLPGGLADLSKVYALGDDGKQDGKALIDLFCEKGKNPDDYPAEWLQFMDYSRHDITALRALYKVMPEWCYTEHEQRVYALDQKINDRGFAVDLDLAQKMIDASALCRASLDARVGELSGGTIQKGTQSAKVQEFVGGLPNMKAETLRKELRDNSGLTDTAREMISLRLLTAKSSTAKSSTALDTASPDGRIRYTTQYGGGGRILRFSHKGFQPGNLPRPERSKEVVADAITALQGGYLDTIWGDGAQAVCADALRGLIIAPPGHKLLVADWRNIEGRMLAWYAGEEWKLEAYRAKDAGAGADMYRLLGQKMTGRKPESFTDAERQQLKGCELSMGYGGGVGAYLNIANSYRLDLVKLADDARRLLPMAHMTAGNKEWAWAKSTGNTHDLPGMIYAACAAYKHAWRDNSPETVKLWTELENVAKSAVWAPGATYRAAGGKVAMKATKDWLAVQLPSGRKIMFAKPRIERTKTENEDGSEYVREQLTALKAPGWRRETVYGGLLANAITQGGCRDILVDAMLRLDELGYPIVMHVHDEIIAEVPDASPFTHESMIEEMTKLPAWCEGLPLTAQGFETVRYRKG